MNMQSFRSGLAMVLGAAVLVGGVLVGTAIARADSSNDTQPLVEDNLTDHSPDPLGRHGLCGIVDEVASDLGMSVDELRQQLRDGATLEDLAAEAGTDLNTILDNVKTALLAEVDQRVADGHLSEDEADAIKERIDSFTLDDLETRDFVGELRYGFGSRFPRFFDNLGSRLGNWLGDLDIDLAELRTKIESGLSLDEALTEMGVDVNSVVENLRQAALDKVDQLLADGTISQERADLMKQQIEDFDLSDGLPFGARFHPDLGGDGFSGSARRGAHGRQFGHRNGTNDDESSASREDMSSI